MKLFQVVLCGLVALSCGPTTSARLYQTQSKAPSLEAKAIENLEHMGPTFTDKGINFAVFSERAERVELLLFDNPEASIPTRQFPMVRFGDVWNLYVEGVGVGQHYGFITFGPNWTYEPDFLPGTIKGFKADVDAQGNRMNPNKLLFDPYGKALHRDHDWSKGSAATGPRRTDSTWAAAAKSVIVKSTYAWTPAELEYRKKRQNENTPGHRWNDIILYELHPKGFTASPASGVDHPGSFRGLGEKASYLKDLGVTAIHLMPPFEKPSDGGYWGYSTMSFFVAENTYGFKREGSELIDEFKWMVEQLHALDIEVYLDVVYNHTGEGGFWREKLEFDFNPDPSVTAQLTNFDPEEVVGLFSFRGFDNAAYYGLDSKNRKVYWNNSGVGNQTRPNYKPFRRLVVDSLRYWVEELHVDGFRFDLAPVLGERDDEFYVWDDPKNTVLQDIADDPVLQKYNTRLISEPWAAGGYDLSKSFNGPGNNPFANGFGTRIGLFPAAQNKPGTGWGEWNGRYRDWWRSFWNRDEFKLNSNEVRDGGFFLTGSSDWYKWNGRKPYHAVNFVTVHDGFTLYDLFSYSMKQNGCGPLNKICCDEPNSSWCEKVSGEDNNRSRDWGSNNEALKRQLMRNTYVALMISHGTPMIYMGDEWLRTQLGNNNAYSTKADNEFNWMDWGSYQAQDHRHRMHDFVKGIIQFRKDHAYALAPSEYDGTKPGGPAPFAWKSAANTEPPNWGSKQLMLHYYDKSRGPELAILINGETADVTFTLPGGRAWKRVVDTQSYWDEASTLTMSGKPLRVSNNLWRDGGEQVGGSYVVKPRSIAIFEAK